MPETPSPSPRRQLVLPRRNVATRDGVDLCTDVYLPPDPEPAPTVLVRTPYGRTLPFLLRMALRLSQQGGCAVVLQDCRGRYQSGGTYDWLREVDDTYDVLCWLAEQEWANGAVGLHGMSITAHPNFLLAGCELPEPIEVRTMVSIMGSVNKYEVAYRGGALVLHWALPWAMMMTGAAGRTAWHDLPWEEVYRHLPLTSAVKEHFGAPSEIWDMMTTPPGKGSVWDRLDTTGNLEGVDVPTLHLSGWYDFMLRQGLTSYRAMHRPEGGARQKLVLGPWDHRTLFELFSAKAPRGVPDSLRINLLELICLWYERWLRPGGGAGAALDDEPDVLLYLPEEGSWLGADTYPVPAARPVDWYLTSGGRGRDDAEDGRLVAEPPARAGEDHFTYDPENPAPTRGGGVWPFPAGGVEAGPLDQAEVEERPDVLLYTTPPLEDDVHVVGAPEVELWAATSARDTDFTFKLVEVTPLGQPLIVQDTIVRGRYHRSVHDEELLTPHRPYRFVLTLPDVAKTFRRGHRIRLEVSSSNFPQFDRNLNTAEPASAGTRSVEARQTVYHGGDRLSRLRLPVVPGGRLAELGWTPSPAWRAE